MKFELLEVAGTYIFSMKAMTLVLFFIFAIIVVGYLVGKISIKGVSLGSAAIFLVALVAGHFKGVAFQDIASWQESLPAVDHYFKLVQNLGLVLFVTSVGLIAGPSFFKNLKKNAKSYVALGGIIIITGCLVCAAITLLVPNINSSMSVGLFAGALTSTPGLAVAIDSTNSPLASIAYGIAYAAAQEAVGEASPLYGNVAVGYAIAYPFGVIGVVLFVQIIPKILHANMDEERAKLVSIQSNDAAGNKQRKLFEMDKFGIAAFFLAVMLGLILGSFHIPLGKGSFNLGTTGGPLIMGLIFGHFGRIGKLSLKVDQHVLSLFQELGLILFLIGAGMDGGAEFVAVLKEYGALLFLWGALMTLIPMIVGFLFAKYVLKLSLFNNLGSICGGMTSTPALGTLIKTANSPNVASAYAATYPIALILVVLLAQFLTRL